MTAFDDALAAVGTLVSMHIESGGAFVQPDADVVEQARAALPVLRAEHDDTRRYLRGCEQWFYPNDTPNKDMAKAVASNYLKLRAEHERVAAERERCAKVADRVAGVLRALGTPKTDEDKSFALMALEEVAAAIRARGETEEKL